MANWVSCPDCGGSLQVPEGDRMIQLRCPKCRHKFSFRNDIGVFYEAELLGNESSQPAEVNKGTSKWMYFILPLFGVALTLAILWLSGALPQQVQPMVATNPSAKESPLPSTPQDAWTTEANAAPLKLKEPEASTTIPVVDEPDPVPSEHRPATGFRIGTWRGANGICGLTTENGLKEDAAVALTPVGSTRPYRYFYIRAGEKFSLKKVRAGKYHLFFQTGMNWNTSKKAFLITTSRQKFEDTLEFQTYDTDSSTKYSVLTVSLHPTEGGTAKTNEVDESAFPIAED